MPRISLIVTVILGLAPITQAQLIPIPGAGTPVVEVGENLVFNGIQAVEAVFHTTQWILDLTLLEDYLFPEGAAEDLALLAGLAEQAESLSFAWSNNRALLDTLFAPATAPMTSFEYRERVMAINDTLFETYGYATDTQTLLLTAIRTVEHIFGFIEIVSGLTGKLSTQQLLAQQLGKLHQLQAEGNLQRSAFERARSLEGVTPGVLQQGIYNITDQMMLDHPRW